MLKLPGLTISSNLSWIEHLNISDVIKKASKRLYFLVRFKKIKSSSAGYVHFLHCMPVYVLGERNY